MSSKLALPVKITQRFTSITCKYLSILLNTHLLCRYIATHNLTLYVCSHSIGRPKHARVMTGGLEGDVFMGPKAEVSILYIPKAKVSIYIPLYNACT